MPIGRSLALVVLSAAIGLITYVDFRLATDPIDVSNPPGEAGESSTGTSGAMPRRSSGSWLPVPLERLSETVARPVFSSTRRPPVPRPAPEPIEAQPEPVAPAEPVAQPQVAIEDLALLGVLLDAASRRALIRTPSDQAGVWVEEGSEIAGWRVSVISRDNATLETSGQRHDLKLYAARTSAEAPEQPQ